MYCHSATGLFLLGEQTQSLQTTDLGTDAASGVVVFDGRGRAESPNREGRGRGGHVGATGGRGRGHGGVGGGRVELVADHWNRGML